MKSIVKTVFIAVVSMAAFASCTQKEIIFDHPFVYITDKNNAATSTVNCMGELIESYTVYMSTKMPNKDINVYFEIIAGNGLQNGIDYTLLTDPSAPLLFPNGTFQRDIRIQWLKHALDSSKDNTLRIVLTGSSENFTLGMPGPAENFKQHIITKIVTD